MSKPTVIVGQATKKLDYDNLIKFIGQGDALDGSAADTTLTAADFGRTVIINSAAARTVFLPSVGAPEIGGWFLIVKLGAGNVTIDAADSDTINGGAAGGTLVNSVAGETFAYVKVRLVSATAWLIEAGMGSWNTSANMFLLGYPDGPLLKQIATPSTPAAGYNRLYSKSDKRIYALDESGQESAILTGYVLTLVALILGSMVDDEIYYFGGTCVAPDTTAATKRVYVPKAGTIKAAYVFSHAVTAGSAENISVYIRKNNLSDALIATVGLAAAVRVFSNTAMSFAVAQGDYIEIVVICPTWATNPLNVKFGGTLYIE